MSHETPNLTTPSTDLLAAAPAFPMAAVSTPLDATSLAEAAATVSAHRHVAKNHSEKQVILKVVMERAPEDEECESDEESSEAGSSS